MFFEKIWTGFGIRIWTSLKLKGIASLGEGPDFLRNWQCFLVFLQVRFFLHPVRPPVGPSFSQGPLGWGGQLAASPTCPNFTASDPPLGGSQSDAVFSFFVDRPQFQVQDRTKPGASFWIFFIQKEMSSILMSHFWVGAAGLTLGTPPPPEQPMAELEK